MLTRRSLSGNALEGTIPATWSGASRLQVLRLDDNRLNGSLAQVALPAGVRELGLRGNALGGEVPTALRQQAPDLRWAMLCVAGPGGCVQASYVLQRVSTCKPLGNNAQAP